jgi:HK97 family phage major capsid protein
MQSKLKSLALRLLQSKIAHAVNDLLFKHQVRTGAIACIVADPELKSVDLEDVKKALKGISDSVREEGEKALKEAEKAGELSAATKAIVDKLLTEQGELKAQVATLEQKAVRAPGGEDDPDSLAAVMAKSWIDAAKDFAEARNMGKSVSIPMSRKALVNSGVTGTALNYPGTQVLAAPLVPLLRRLTVRDLLAQGRMSKAVLFYQRESGFTNNAAPVSEGSLKPKSELTFELITQAVRTIAHLFDISLQMLDDVDFIQSYIESRGRYGLKLVEEAQLLNGSGTGQNLAGLYTLATPYNLTLDNIPNPTGATNTDIDKLRLAILQVELAYASSTGIVLHPSNWAGIELTKDTQNRYIFANPQDTTTGRLWGRDVVSTQAMTQDRFLVGDFQMAAQIFDRQDANVAISYENKDNFERNMATIRIEERLALAVYRPEALVKGTLESAS